MNRIFAIGGGELVDLETLTIDKEIVKATGLNQPKALFIPTASGEPQGYVDGFASVYGERLGCTVDTLYLLQGTTSQKEAYEQIMDADLIYVGGGNTQMMMDTWRKYGVDKALKEAYQNGTVLAGLSAGSICWFESGHSDSLSFETNDAWSYIRVEGLGLITGMHCPHFNEGNRESDFEQMLERTHEVGLAIENNCAVEFLDNTYRVLKSDQCAKAYRMISKDGIIEKTELTNQDKYESL